VLPLDVKVVKYSELFDQISRSTLASYEIRKNEIYRDIVETMDIEMKSPRTKDPDVEE
jgi:hypothetical protein